MLRAGVRRGRPRRRPGAGPALAALGRAAEPGAAAVARQPPPPGHLPALRRAEGRRRRPRRQPGRQPGGRGVAVVLLLAGDVRHDAHREVRPMGVPRARQDRRLGGEVSTATRTACRFWSARVVHETVSMPTQFLVTCAENRWKLTLVGSINFLGQLLGMPFSGVFSDRQVACTSTYHLTWPRHHNRSVRVRCPGVIVISMT